MNVARKLVPDPDPEALTMSPSGQPQLVQDAPLHYFHYNFVRKHATLKTTPAVAAGIATRAMTMLDLVEMIERDEKLTGGRLTNYLPAAS